MKNAYIYLQNEQVHAGAKDCRCKFMAFLHFFALVLEKKVRILHFLAEKFS